MGQRGAGRCLRRMKADRKRVLVLPLDMAPAKWGVRVIHKSSQMCIQANSECPLVLQHIIKNNSERQGQTPSPPVFWCPLSRCHFFPKNVGQNLSHINGGDGWD